MKLPRKFWFKLQQLKSRWDESGGGSSPSYDKSHRMCPSCRALIDRSEKVCPLCGAKTGPVRARSSPGSEPGRIMGVIPIPSTATSAMAAACILMYIVEWFLSQKSGPPVPAMLGLPGIRPMAMLRLGAKFGPLMFAGQWWRLVTAMFLHAGLLHIGMNMWCLFDLGPEVESLFDAPRFIVFYLATGVFGYIVSLWWSPGVLSIGASGAIMGLIGVLIGASFHLGRLGKDYRSMLWKWVIYIFIFGLFFSVDNAAHIGGLVLGLALGYLIPSGEVQTRTEQKLWNTLAVISVLIIAASFALMAMQINQPYY
jgi:rhomboid protease GluP